MTSGDDSEVQEDDGDEAAPPTPHELSDSELHDVTVADSPASEFEAIALVDVLEEAGIPAMTRGGIVGLGAGRSSEVMVPRKLLDKAKAVIAATRSEAVERGVEDAFTPESVAEREDDPRKSLAVRKLLDAEGEARERIIFEHVSQSLADGASPPEIAQYLAVAGLTREEADAVIENVRTQRSHLIREKLESRQLAGNSLAIAGMIAFVAAIYVIFRGEGYYYPILASFGTIIGFALASDAKSKLAALDKKQP